MTAVTIIIDLVLIIVSIILILTVLMQQGQRQGLGAIGGGAETFFGKNKAKSYEGKLAKLTKICAVVFIALAFTATIVTGIDTNNDADAESTTPVVTVAPEATDEAAADESAEPEATDEAAADESAEPDTTDEAAADESAEPDTTEEAGDEE